MSAAFSLSLISAVIIWHAYSSDSHWEDASQIYVLDRRVGNSNYRIPAGFLQDLRFFSADILQIASTSVVRISYKKGSRVQPAWIQRLDGNFVEMFPLETSSGDYASTLRRNDTVALSEETARKLYGEQVAVGQVFEELTDGVSKIYTVGAVYTPPENTTLIKSRILLQIQTGDDLYYVQFFLKLKKGTNVSELVAGLNELLKSKYPDRRHPGKADLRLVPLKGAKLEDLSDPSAKKHYFGLFISSTLMLLVALLNYSSLSAAIAQTRLKGFALRKVLGARTAELVLLSVLETLVVVSLSYLLAIVVAVFIAPYIGTVTGSSFTVVSVDQLPLLVWGWCLALLSGVVVTTIPVWLMLRNRSISVLRTNQGSVTGGGTKFRFTMLVLQSMFGLGLAFGAGVSYFQVQNLAQADKGFDTDGIVYIYLSGQGAELQDAAHSLVEAFRRVNGVENAALIRSGNPLQSRVRERQAQHPVSLQRTQLATMNVGENFTETLGLPVLAGRIPLPPVASIEGGDEPDLIKVMVNQRLVRDFDLGSPTDALGECLFYIVDDQKGDTCHQITAVVGDHFQNVAENPITPIVFIPSSGNRFYTTVVRFTPGMDKEVMAAITAAWDSQVTSEIWYRFLDDIIDRDLGLQRAVALVLVFIAVGSMLLVITGLYAMAKFIVSSRRREIAIRRVMGGSTLDVLQLIIYWLIRPLAIGAIIGLPVSWYLAARWLQTYAIRIEPEPWHAVLLGIVGICITLLTSTAEILRATRIRPANVLYHE